MHLEVQPPTLTAQAPVIGRQGGQVAQLAGQLRGLAGVAGATGSPEAAAAGAPMNPIRRGVIGLLALALVASCTAKSKEPTVTFEDAQRRVVALVDETLAAALPTLRLDEPAPIGRHPCNDALGAPSQDIYLDFERSFPIDGPPAERLVANVERIWRQRGYAVERDDNDQQVSIRNATVDGYAMAL